MNNEFKLRLYKKTGPEKGNLDKELFYDFAKELWTAYKSLCRISDYSINLNPTIWVRSGEEDWTRYGEADFAKFFLGGKRQIDIISENIKYTGELCMDLEKETIEAVWELWFDVDRYFGTDTDSDDVTWINFYTYWHSNGRVTAMYEIDSEETTKVIDWPLTDKEEEFFLLKMEEYALKKEHCSLENQFQFEKEYDALCDDAGNDDSYLHKVAYNFLLRANYERWDGAGEIPITFNKKCICVYPTGIPGGILRLSVTEDNNEWKYVLFCNGIRSTGEQITKTESIPTRANDAELEHGLKKLISEFKEAFSKQFYCYKGVSYPIAPLTKEAVCRYKDDNNYIRGIVKVELSDMIENDLEGFLDLISEKLTGSPLLMDIGYEPVSVFEKELYLLVSGDVSGILDEEQNNEGGMEMNNEMVRRACHAIGMDNKQPFYKYGEKHFISYRNYSVSNRLGDEYFDKMESEGLAESDRGKQSVTYYLTEKGFQWLEKECSMVIHAKNRPEKKYHLNKDDEEQIIEIWAWLKKKEIYTSEFPEELDVAIWLDTDAMESFFEYFGNEENPVPARIYQNAILVLFSDVLDFKVTGMQIWSFRPHGMREEW